MAYLECSLGDEDDDVTDRIALPASPGTLTRRSALAGGVLTCCAGFALPALAQRGGPNIAVDELAKSGADLPDIVVGKADAPVTIIEYASMTCPHCATFHATVLPQLKTKYIDTGKAKLIFREFPLDDLAMAASMLARCAGGEGPAALISDLFKRQETWAFVRSNPVPKLFEMAKQAGFTQASFDKCLTDQKLLDQITAIRKRGGDVFKVTSTPSFFVNGTRVSGGGTLADFEKLIEPLLPKS